MNAIAMKPGTMGDPQWVIFRGPHGESPAVLLSVDADERANLLVFDRAMVVEAPPESALVTNQPRPSEAIVMGRSLGDIPHVRRAPAVAPCWGRAADFAAADRQAPASLLVS